VNKIEKEEKKILSEVIDLDHKKEPLKSLII